MFRALVSVLAILLAGCAPTGDQAVETVVEQEERDRTDVQQTVAEPRKELDLSMPEGFFADGVEITGEPQPERFDAAELFDRDEQESVNVTVTPRIEDSRDQRLPEVDGATVTVEKKTR